MRDFHLYSGCLWFWSEREILKGFRFTSLAFDVSTENHLQTIVLDHVSSTSSPSPLGATIPWRSNSPFKQLPFKRKHFPTNHDFLAPSAKKTIHHRATDQPTCLPTSLTSFLAPQTKPNHKTTPTTLNLTNNPQQTKQQPRASKTTTHPPPNNTKTNPKRTARSPLPRKQSKKKRHPKSP